MRARQLAAAARGALLCLGFLRASDAAAQRANASVRRLGDARIIVEPGALTTLTFRVENRSDAPLTTRGRLLLPPDWQLAVPVAPLTLPPHASEVELLRIALPAHARAGVYVLRYGAADAGATDSVVVSVPERHALTLRLREAPTFIPAGEPYDLVFDVSNGGNAPVVVHLGVSGSEAFPLRLDSGVVRLSTGQDHPVRVRVQTDASGSRTRSNQVRLTATVEGDTTRIEPAVSVVEVVPRHAGRAPRFHSVPAQLTVRQVDRAAHPVAELRGGGSLSPRGATTTEFLFRGLDQTASLFGEQDEYWLAVTAPGYRLRLGDRTAPYSRLGESWRSGVGADGELTLGDVQFGAFAQRERRGPVAARVGEGGASIGLHPADRLLAEARFVSRSGPNPADVWTAHGQLSPWGVFALDGELGRGRDSLGSGGAYAVSLSGSLPRASIAIRRVAADSGFPGLTRGTTSSEAAATVVPISRLSLSASATDWSAIRTRMLPGPSGTGQRALDGRAAWGQWIEAGYRTSTESRESSAGRRERRSQSMRFSAGVPLGLATLRGALEQGTSVFDDAPAAPIPFRRVDVRGSLGRGANVVAASVEWVSGMAPSAWMPDDHLRGALTASVPVTPATRLSLALSATRYAGDRARTPVVVDVGLVQGMPFGQRASWRTRAMSYGAGGPPVRPMQQADYMVPLGLPIGPAAASGRVQARVVDRETGRPLPGMLLHIGDRVRVTDADGRVTFDGLADATHYLEVDRGALGADLVVVPGAVLPVAVHGGETKAVELALTRGAAVRGQLRRFDAGASGVLGQPETLVDSGTVPGTVLQLSSGRDSLRVSVDAWGGFTFGRVAPGRWVLSVVQADLPGHHRFEEDRQVLDLAPGDARELLLRVIPAAPPVQMIASAELTLEANGATRVRTEAPAPAPAGQWSTSGPRSVPLATVDGSVARGSASDELHTPPWQPGLRRPVPAAVAARLRPMVRIVPPPAEEVRRPTVRVVPPPPEEATPPKVRIVPPPVAERQRPIVRMVPPPVTSHHYTVTRWEVSLVQVARAMYGDSSLWPKIWLANLEQVPDPDAIRPGQRLLIPDKAPLTDEERIAGEQYRARRR